MPRTREHFKELWSRVDEVNNLRDEEHQKCLAKVAMNTNNCKSNASKVAVGIAYKY